MTLSVIIVNFRTPDLILQCLGSFSPQTSGINIEVLVVDNASGDDSENIICSRFPQVRWMQMEYNAGFARANNKGIRESRGELILLLNPDTIVVGDAITACALRFADSQYVAAGVQLLNSDGSPQISGNYFMTGGWNHLMAVPYTGALLRQIGLALRVKKTNLPQALGTVEVDWINGAFLMTRRDATVKAGLLDEDFFLYSEEIEWCSRLKKLGQLCIFGDMHVVHLIGGSADQAFKSKNIGYLELSDRKGFQLMLSGLLRIRKQFGIGWFLFHLLFITLSSLLGLLLLPFSFLFHPRDAVRIWRHHWSNSGSEPNPGPPSRNRASLWGNKDSRRKG